MTTEELELPIKDDKKSKVGVRHQLPFHLEQLFSLLTQEEALMQWQPHWLFGDCFSESGATHALALLQEWCAQNPFVSANLHSGHQVVAWQWGDDKSIGFSQEPLEWSQKDSRQCLQRLMTTIKKYDDSSTSLAQASALKVKGNGLNDSDKKHSWFDFIQESGVETSAEMVALLNEVDFLLSALWHDSELQATLGFVPSLPCVPAVKIKWFGGQAFGLLAVGFHPLFLDQRSQQKILQDFQRLLLRQPVYFPRHSLALDGQASALTHSRDNSETVVKSSKPTRFSLVRAELWASKQPISCSRALRETEYWMDSLLLTPPDALILSDIIQEPPIQPLYHHFSSSLEFKKKLQQLNRYGKRWRDVVFIMSTVQAMSEAFPASEEVPVGSLFWVPLELYSSSETFDKLGRLQMQMPIRLKWRSFEKRHLLLAEVSQALCRVCMISGFPHHELLNCLESPFVFSGNDLVGVGLNWLSLPEPHGLSEVSADCSIISELMTCFHQEPQPCRERPFQFGAAKDFSHFMASVSSVSGFDSPDDLLKFSQRWNELLEMTLDFVLSVEHYRCELFPYNLLQPSAVSKYKAPARSNTVLRFLDEQTLKRLLLTDHPQYELLVCQCPKALDITRFHRTIQLLSEQQPVLRSKLLLAASQASLVGVPEILLVSDTPTVELKILFIDKPLLDSKGVPSNSSSRDLVLLAEAFCRMDPKIDCLSVQHVLVRFQSQWYYLVQYYPSLLDGISALKYWKLLQASYHSSHEISSEMKAHDFEALSFQNAIGNLLLSEPLRSSDFLMSPKATNKKIKPSLKGKLDCCERLTHTLSGVGYEYVNSLCEKLGCDAQPLLTLVWVLTLISLQDQASDESGSSEDVPITRQNLTLAVSLPAIRSQGPAYLLGPWEQLSAYYMKVQELLNLPLRKAKAFIESSDQVLAPILASASEDIVTRVTCWSLRMVESASFMSDSDQFFLFQQSVFDAECLLVEMSGRWQLQLSAKESFLRSHSVSLSVLPQLFECVLAQLVDGDSSFKDIDFDCNLTSFFSDPAIATSMFGSTLDPTVTESRYQQYFGFEVPRQQLAIQSQTLLKDSAGKSEVLYEKRNLIEKRLQLLVERFPEHSAFRMQNFTLSYSELCSVAQSVCGFCLSRMSVLGNRMIGLYVLSSIDRLLLSFGLLWSGVRYCILNPQDSMAFNQDLLIKAGVSLVIIDPEMSELIHKTVDTTVDFQLVTPEEIFECPPASSLSTGKGEFCYFSSSMKYGFEMTTFSIRKILSAVDQCVTLSGLPQLKIADPLAPFEGIGVCSLYPINSMEFQIHFLSALECGQTFVVPPTTREGTLLPVELWANFYELWRYYQSLFIFSLDMIDQSLYQISQILGLKETDITIAAHHPVGVPPNFVCVPEVTSESGLKKSATEMVSSEMTVRPLGFSGGAESSHILSQQWYYRGSFCVALVVEQILEKAPMVESAKLLLVKLPSQEGQPSLLTSVALLLCLDPKNVVLETLKLVLRRVLPQTLLPDLWLICSAQTWSKFPRYQSLRHKACGKRTINWHHDGLQASLCSAVKNQLVEQRRGVLTSRRYIVKWPKLFDFIAVSLERHSRRSEIKVALIYGDQQWTYGQLLSLYLRYSVNRCDEQFSMVQGQGASHVVCIALLSLLGSFFDTEQESTLLNLSHWFVKEAALCSSDKVLLRDAGHSLKMAKILLGSWLTGATVVFLSDFEKELPLYDKVSVICDSLSSFPVQLPLFENSGLRHIFLSYDLKSSDDHGLFDRLRGWLRQQEKAVKVTMTYETVSRGETITSYVFTEDRYSWSSFRGKAIENVQLMVMDEYKELLPPGKVGALYMAKRDLGGNRGYSEQSGWYDEVESLDCLGYIDAKLGLHLLQ